MDEWSNVLYSKIKNNALNFDLLKNKVKCIFTSQITALYLGWDCNCSFWLNGALFGNHKVKVTAPTGSVPSLS